MIRHPVSRKLLIGLTYAYFSTNCVSVKLNFKIYVPDVDYIAFSYDNYSFFTYSLRFMININFWVVIGIVRLIKYEWLQIKNYDFVDKIWDDFNAF